jgi:hypothetical protein
MSKKSITVSLNDSHDMEEVEITFALNDRIIGRSGGVSFDYDKDGNIDHVFVDEDLTGDDIVDTSDEQVFKDLLQVCMKIFDGMQAEP